MLLLIKDVVHDRSGQQAEVRYVPHSQHRGAEQEKPGMNIKLLMSFLRHLLNSLLHTCALQLWLLPHENEISLT